jgi:hypothetical protein
LAGRSVSFASFFAEFAVFGWIFLRVLWHPRFGVGLLALPLCGAAPTFLCSGKEK